MSPIVPRAYPPDITFGDAYERVRHFLLRANRERLAVPFFPWAAWEWIFCLRYVDEEEVQKYLLWEEEGEIVGLSTFDDDPNKRYFDVDPAHPALKEVMLAWSLAHHRGDAPFALCISDADPRLQGAARRLGMRPTAETESGATLDLRGDLSYSLPAGFTLRAQAEGFDLHKFNRCLWRGFDRVGEVDSSERRLDFRRRQLSGPNQVAELNLMVVAPNGDYAAYCGMWHEAGTHYAYVEPVCTDPDYRRLGLGKAAVLEAAQRCAARGAATALVASGQEFYWRIGFNPIPAERWWRSGGCEAVDA